LRPDETGSTLTGPVDDRVEVGVKLDKQELVRVLHTEGDNETADKVAAQLPDEIDTERDGEALDGLGLDRTQLMAKLAGGGFGGTIAP
jgi:hypothetical protein